MRGEQIVLHRSAVNLRAAEAARRAGIPSRRRDRRLRLLTESIAAHFRGRARAEGLDPERTAVLWTESWVSYRTGEVHDQTVALLRWQGDAVRDVVAHWRPDSRTLDAHWPAPGGL